MKSIFTDESVVYIHIQLEFDTFFDFVLASNTSNRKPESRRNYRIGES